MRLLCDWLLEERRSRGCGRGIGDKDDEKVSADSSLDVTVRGDGGDEDDVAGGGGRTSAMLGPVRSCLVFAPLPSLFAGGARRTRSGGGPDDDIVVQSSCSLSTGEVIALQVSF